ncbi:hypothetical protein H0O02_00070 [Candidatus Micrarchaeota archaeon]|nr:hypothetical protein [Candidatus Micrarchaeota archaeon]
MFVSTAASAQLGCQPGVSECIDSSSYHTCGDYAVWNPAVTCTAGQTCSDGECHAMLGCSPGDSECTDSRSYHVCSSRAVWGPTQYCAGGQTCAYGACTPVPQCSYGQTRCSPSDSSEIQTCNAQYQWQNWRYCGNGCYNGACHDCSRGSTRCSDDYSYETCDSDGEWGPSHSCGRDYICDGGSCIRSSEGECQSVGAARCSPDDANTLQHCGSNYRWQDWKFCQNGCDYSMCVACGTGETQCMDSQSYARCDSQGQWGAAIPCQSGYLCSSGSCQAPSGDQCATPGLKRCSPANANMVQMCGSNNLYQDYLQCNDGCYNAQCAECDAGTKVCAGATSYRTCNAAGQLSDPINCPDGYTCDNGGHCIATPQCTDGQRNCISDSVYGCSGGQWQLLYHCASDSDCKEASGTAYCEQESAPPQPPPQPGIIAELGTLGVVFVATTIVLAAALVYFYIGRKK